MNKFVQLLLLMALSLVFISCASGQNNLNVEDVKQKAIAGDKEAQYTLGVLYERQKNFQEALDWYMKSAMQNYDVAQTEVGNFYAEGRTGIDKDFNKAFEWYQKAAENGYFDAINNLAGMYNQGRGTEKDQLKAAQLYELAASKGSIRAMYNLGVVYKNGEGVEKNMIQAYKWFDLGRYYTTFSKDMTLKWSIRKKLDDLKSIMSPSEIKEAEALATQWVKAISSQIKLENKAKE